MLKIKEDFRDLIYTEKNEFRKILFEEVKVMKNYNAQLKIAQVDFIEIADKYLKDNKLYFNSYKNFNKFIKYDDNLINLLKTK